MDTHTRNIENDDSFLLYVRALITCFALTIIGARQAHFIV